MGHMTDQNLEGNSFFLSTKHFRELIQKPQKGSLKLYTTRANPDRLLDIMIGEGQQLLEAGLDVVLALDAELSKADIPESRIVPARNVSLNEKTILEMDYEQILIRAPQIVIAADLLHANISESGHSMRFEDIKCFLDRGISVLSSASSMHSEMLGQALRHICGNFTIPLDRWASLPPGEIVTLFFTPMESFHHAELSASVEKAY
jgi:K+-sensing histidine kinase KdpD